MRCWLAAATPFFISVPVQRLKAPIHPKKKHQHPRMHGKIDKSKHVPVRIERDGQSGREREGRLTAAVGLNGAYSKRKNSRQAKTKSEG